MCFLLSDSMQSLREQVSEGNHQVQTLQSNLKVIVVSGVVVHAEICQGIASEVGCRSVSCDGETGDHFWCGREFGNF